MIKHLEGKASADCLLLSAFPVPVESGLLSSVCLWNCQIPSFTATCFCLALPCLITHPVRASPRGRPECRIPGELLVPLVLAAWSASSGLRVDEVLPSCTWLGHWFPKSHSLWARKPKSKDFVFLNYLCWFWKQSLASNEISCENLFFFPSCSLESVE